MSDPKTYPYETRLDVRYGPLESEESTLLHAGTYRLIVILRACSRALATS